MVAGGGLTVAGLETLVRPARTTREQNLEAVSARADLFDDLYSLGGKTPDMPPIVEFAEHPSLLARPPLFPRQKTILRLIYGEVETMTQYDFDVIGQWADDFYKGGDRAGVPPDIWERISWLHANGWEHFREVMFVGGRRAGKGHIGAIALARQMYRLMSMRSPQLELGIDPDKDLVALITATNFLQARDNQFADLHAVVTKAPVLQRQRDGTGLASAKAHEIKLRTAADVARLRIMTAAGVPQNREIATIQAKAVTSNAKAGRGVASFAQAYDEMAHMLVGTAGPRTAEEVYGALTPALNQVGKHALIYIPTSPYTKIGAAFEIYEDALSLNDDGGPEYPEMLVVQLPAWGPYEDWDAPPEGRAFVSIPSGSKEDLERIEKRNPQKFRVEIRAQWAEVIDAYLPPGFVDQLFDPLGDRVLDPQPRGIPQWTYRIHMDPSKSQHNFALCVGHTEPIEESDGEVWDHVFIDVLKVWRPADYEDSRIRTTTSPSRSPTSRSRSPRRARSPPTSSVVRRSSR